MTLFYVPTRPSLLDFADSLDDVLEFMFSVMGAAVSSTDTPGKERLSNLVMHYHTDGTVTRPFGSHMLVGHTRTRQHPECLLYP